MNDESIKLSCALFVFAPLQAPDNVLTRFKTPEGFHQAAAQAGQFCRIFAKPAIKTRRDTYPNL